MSDLVSVIIPASNPGEFIRETIDSVIAQTYSNFEIIIVDDGSSDNTGEIIGSIRDDRIKYYYQPKSGMPAQVRNKAVGLSRGELIAFLDHDDVWMPKKLEVQIAVIKNNLDIALVSTNAYYMYDGKKTERPLVVGVRNGYFRDRVFIPRNGVVQSTVLVKRSIFDKVGGFNESADLFAIEDYDFWVRVYAAKSPCYYLSDPTMYFRKNTGSASGRESQVLKRSLHHYNKYFSSFGFSKKINRARLFEILVALYFRKIFLGDKQCAESLRSERLPKGVLATFLIWAVFSLPHKFIDKMYELIKYGPAK